MGIGKKIKNMMEKAKGGTKQGVGTVTDDPALKAEGRADKGKGDIKQAGEKVKDVFKD